MIDADLEAAARKALAASAGRKVATAESCTGGLVGAALTAVPGSSSVYERGFITYSNAAKTEMIGVEAALIGAYGAVSEPVARAMAEGARAAARVDAAVSITGIAGPGGSEHKPEGRVCFGLAVTGRATHVETIEFGAIGRAHVRKAAALRALELLAQAADSAPQAL